MSVRSPPPPFRAQSIIDDPRTFSHHSSISRLWSTKWRKPCELGVYPFVHAEVEDFDPIFDQLKAISQDSTSILYDPDAYAAPFLPVGERLVAQAEKAEKEGDTAQAKGLYLRASAVYRIARFPINRSKLSQQAWEAGKDAYLRGGKYLDPPNSEVLIPFKHADIRAGDKDTSIPACLRIPTGERPKNGWPVVLIICGLDGYRTDSTNRTDMHTQSGLATLSLEIPGTGDCPAARKDPGSADRLFSSVLDWITDSRAKYGFDDNKIVARGISTGGYYGFRIAHTHADRLLAAVGQGGWCHHVFEPQWIRAMNHMEYPFALADAFAYRMGYKSVEDLIADNPKAKFSLVNNSQMLDKPSCRLLVINGMEDTVFPIEDSILVACRGTVKDVRFLEGIEHVGNPGAEAIINDWVNEVVAEAESKMKPVRT